MPTILKATFQNASFLVVVQLIVRAVTIVTNAFVVRSVDQETLGLINVRLLLLEAIILLFSRDAIRKACLENIENHNWPKVMNLTWIVLPLCMCFSAIMAMVWLYLLEAPPVHMQEDYVVGVWSMALSCIIEMFGEPPSLVTRAFFYNKLRVTMSLIYLSVRTSVFIMLVKCDPKKGILAFSMAQLVSAIVWVLGYYIYFYFHLQNPHRDLVFPRNSLREFLPSYGEKGEKVPSHLIQLSWGLFGNVLVKHVLGEGERYVMTVTGILSLAEQGAYDLVWSLGTLPYRLLLRPLEDSYVFYFAQTFKRTEHVSLVQQEYRLEVFQVLYFSMRCAVFVGLLMISVGASHARLLLFLYGGEKMAADPAPTLLQAHCAVFLCLALNTVAEAFSTTTMSPSKLKWYNWGLLVLAIVYLVSSWALTTVLGPIGLIFANFICIALRVIYSLYETRARYKDSQWKPLSGLVLSNSTLLILLAHFLINMTSQSFFTDLNDWPAHFGIGLVSFMLSVVAFLYSEHALWGLMRGVAITRVSSPSKQD